MSGLKTWQAKIPGCFVGGGFAAHPADEQRAFELLAQLRDEGVGWAELEAYVDSWLSTSHAAPRAEALVDLERFMRVWLID